MRALELVGRRWRFADTAAFPLDLGDDLVHLLGAVDRDRQGEAAHPCLRQCRLSVAIACQLLPWEERQDSPAELEAAEVLGLSGDPPAECAVEVPHSRQVPRPEGDDIQLRRDHARQSTCVLRYRTLLCTESSAPRRDTACSCRTRT